MIRNIFGNFQVTAEDYALKISDEIKRTNIISIKPREETDKGVIADDFIDGAGIYFIFYKNNLMYIGYTNNSIRDRIGKWFGGIRDTLRRDENHSAARKFAKVYGNKCEDMTLKVIPLDFTTLLCDVTIQEIEEELIYSFKPEFNNEIHRNRDIMSHEIELEKLCTMF